ncbi:UNVERIFIED_CONTAM: hypothetical protein K2H54_048676 [Gekko kuhli]
MPCHLQLSASDNDQRDSSMVGLSPLTLQPPDHWTCPLPRSTPRVRDWAPLPWAHYPSSSLHSGMADDDRCSATMFGASEDSSRQRCLRGTLCAQGCGSG